MILLQFGLLLGAAALVSAKSVPESCVVSPWGEWTECRGQCPAKKGASWSAGPEEVYDDGREKMQRTMAAKLKHWSTLQSCTESWCPVNEQQACSEDGFAGVYPCRNIELSSFVDFATLGANNNNNGFGNDIWGWKDEQEGQEVQDYVIMGTAGGSAFVRVTDPEAPEALGFLPTQTGPSPWRDMKVVNDHIFIVSEAARHGMQVFDLTRLRGLSADSSRRFTVDAHYPGVGNSHNIASNPETNTVFIIGATVEGENVTTCSGGIHMIDVSDPKNPVFDGCYATDGYSHDIECVIYRGPDSRYTGNEICWGYNENTLTIVDITDRTSPVLLSRTGYEGYAYTHQGWLSSDQKWALLDDELDEDTNPTDKRTRTYIWNVENLENPVNTEIYYSTETAIDHNMYIYPRHNGDWVFQANYEAGLRLLHFDTETGTLTEYGYFDAHPDSTEATFSGVWSNYPFGLKDGAVAVSSINYGLFLVTPDWAAIDAEVAAAAAESSQSMAPPHGQQKSYRTVLSAAAGGATCPQLSKTRPCDHVTC